MGGEEERIQNRYIFTNMPAPIYVHYSHTCDRILDFTNRLQVFIADTFYCSFQWQSHGYGFHLCSITQKRVTAHPSFLIITLICLPTIADLVPHTSKPLLWLGLGLWTPKPLSQHQACLSEVFPMISDTDPMVVIVVHCLIDITW